MLAVPVLFLPFEGFFKPCEDGALLLGGKDMRQGPDSGLGVLRRKSQNPRGGCRRQRLGAIRSSSVADATGRVLGATP